MEIKKNKWGLWLIALVLGFLWAYGLTTRIGLFSVSPLWLKAIILIGLGANSSLLAALLLREFLNWTAGKKTKLILAGLANRRASWNARVFIEGRERFDLAAWTARHGRPDIGGISTITATVKRGYQLAAECRARGIPANASS